MITALDADVLIYAAAPGHPLGTTVRAVIHEAAATHLIGSVLLLPETLAKPMREGRQDEIDALLTLLSSVTLLPLDEATASLATSLAAEYSLKAADAVHLATAVAAGADRFMTNNRRDYTARMSEVAILHPDPQ